MKVRVETAYGEIVERIPACIKWATQVRHTLHSCRQSSVCKRWFCMVVNTCQ